MVWATLALTAAQLFMQGAANSAKNDALEDEQHDRDDAVGLRVGELKRQQGRANVVATEERSDIALAMDIELGSILAAAGDGGRTNVGTSALAGALAATGAKDIARIEGNRREGQSARRASSVAIIQENVAHQAGSKQKVTANNISFFGQALGTVSSTDAFKKFASPTPSMTPGGGGPKLGPGMSSLSL